jgi:hypothetical protein
MGAVAMNRTLALLLILGIGSLLAGCFSDNASDPAIVGNATGAVANTSSTQATERVWVPCRYPEGWDSTDSGQAVAGTPNGIGHQCLVKYNPSDGQISVPCKNSNGPSSAENFYGLPMRAEYDCKNSAH